MAELRVRIRVSRPLARWGTAAILVSAFAVELSTETAYLSTYYPAPSGVYNRMITTGETCLARDSGNVGVGTTSPRAKLDVNEAARFGSDVSAAGKVSAGDVRIGGRGVVTSVSCAARFTCTKSGNTLTIAPSCGVQGQACCGGTTCGSGLVCASNICQPPPACAAGPWTNQACGQGGCASSALWQTRSCIPAGCQGSCGSLSQCVANDPSCPPACTGATAWTVGQCGAMNGTICRWFEVNMTRSCSPAGCQPCVTSQCVNYTYQSNFPGPGCGPCLTLQHYCCPPSCGCVDAWGQLQYGIPCPSSSPPPPPPPPPPPSNCTCCMCACPKTVQMQCCRGCN